MAEEQEKEQGKEEENQNQEGEKKEETQEEEIVQAGTSHTEMNNLLTMMADTIRATNERTAKLEEAITNLNRQPVVQEKKEDVDSSEWINQPEKNTRRVVKEVVEETIQPIKDLTNEFMKDKQLNSTLQEYARLGGDRAKQLLHKYREFIPQVMKSQASTIANLDASLMWLIGQESMGRITVESNDDSNNNDNKEVPTTRNDKNMRSPTTRSTPAVVVKKKEDVPVSNIPITESMRALARRAGVTDEKEMIALLNGDSRVDSWPRREKKG